MALSGNFSGSTGNQYIYPEIHWSAVQSIDGNYSDVTATLYYSRSNSGYTTTGTWSGGITINGSRTSGSRYLEISYHSETMAISSTVRVYHDADGSKSITISADGSVGGTTLSSTSISAIVTLDTIPRASAISVPELTMGAAGTITITPAVSGFRHTLWYVFGTLEGTIVSKTAATSVSWTPPKDLATQIPGNTVGIGRIYCDTYNGSQLIGTTSQQVYITVSDDTVPTISSVTIAEATAGLAAKFGAYVQNKSTLAVSITAAGIYGSTIAKYETTILSVTYRDASFTSGVITGSGTVSVVVAVTDSRGRTSKTTKNITVLPYAPPNIIECSAWRITSAGANSDGGNRIALKLNYTIASVGGKNDKTYNFRYKKSGDTSFTSFASGAAEAAYNDTQKFIAAPTISPDYAYVIRVEIKDYFQTIAYEVQIPTAFTLMDFRATGKGIAFGKVSEKDTFEVAMDAEFVGNVKAESIRIGGKTLLDWTHPIGSIYASTSATDPKDLFGGTWVRIKDRFLLAAGDSYSAGATGGEATHTLTVAEMPSHIHAMMYYLANGSTSWGYNFQSPGAPSDPTLASGGMYPSGESKAHNNMPPYLVVYVWQRTS